jgi:hypothetical protein
MTKLNVIVAAIIAATSLSTNASNQCIEPIQKLCETKLDFDVTHERVSLHKARKLCGATSCAVVDFTEQSCTVYYHTIHELKSNTPKACVSRVKPQLTS